MNKIIIILLYFLVTNNVNAANDDNLATRLREHFIGETLQEENYVSDSEEYDQTNNSISSQTYDADSEFEDAIEKRQKQFNKLQKFINYKAFNSVLLIIGFGILFRHLTNL